jgi:hypothetical protein
MELISENEIALTGLPTEVDKPVRAMRIAVPPYFVQTLRPGPFQPHNDYGLVL